MSPNSTSPFWKRVAVVCSYICICHRRIFAMIEVFEEKNIYICIHIVVSPTSTSPLWKRVAFVANVTSKFPSALKKSIRAFQWNIFTLFLTPFSSWTLLPTQHHYQYQDNHQHLQKLPKIKKKNGVATNYACLRHWLNLCKNNKQLWGTTYCWPGLLLCVSIIVSVSSPSECFICVLR